MRREVEARPAEGDDGGVGDPSITDPPPAPVVRDTWSASELVTWLNANDVDPPVDLGTVSPAAQARRLGTALRAHRDRRFRNHILRMRSKDGTVRWWLEAVNATKVEFVVTPD